MQLDAHVWRRTIERLDGLSDEEYLWEPVHDCWSVRRAADGTYRADWAPAADPAPFTTIAWRLCHLTSCYGSRRNAEWLGLPAEGGATFEQLDPVPRTATAAIESLSAARARWSAVLGSLSDAAWTEKLGPVAGPFAEADKAGFVLHMVDEFIHHAAEVALLRDLWRAQRG